MHMQATISSNSLVNQTLILQHRMYCITGIAKLYYYIKYV